MYTITVHASAYTMIWILGHTAQQAERQHLKKRRKQTILYHVQYVRYTAAHEEKHQNTEHHRQELTLPKQKFTFSVSVFNNSL